MCPGEGNVLKRDRHKARNEEMELAVVFNTSENRAVVSGVNFEFNWIAKSDLNDLCSDLHRFPLAVVEVLVALDLLQVEVDVVHFGVGHSPSRMGGSRNS